MVEPTEDGGATGSHTVDPALAESTSSVKKVPQRDPKLVERDTLLADMDAKIEAARAAENEAFLRDSGADPQRLMLARQMEREANGEATIADGAQAEELEDGAQFVEPIRQAAPEKREAQRISNKGDDPLGDFVIRVNGKPMFKTLVDGQEKLIPLDTARAQLQKHLSADIRLQQAATRNKELDNRAAVLRATEERLKHQAAAPARQAVDDATLDTEAVELVRSLVSEPEDKAAARLAKTLKTIRQASVPQIDVDGIVKRAGDEAEARIVARDNEKAMGSGFKAFETAYPDIVADPDLFASADRRTDAIAQEHPEWAPEQVMVEAGRQTHEWMKSIGIPVRAVPNGGQSPSNRQQRKEGLRPMPTPRQARPAQAPEQSDRQSPSDAVAEMRKARGQPA
jgi:hypothetical protein